MAITTDQVEEVETASEVESTAELVNSLNPPGSRWRAWAIIALAVTVVALGGVSVKLGLEVRGNQHDDDRDHAVADTARRIAVQLVSLNHTSAKQNLDAIAADSTGSFRDQWDQISGNFASVLQSGQVESTGAIEESGIVTIDDAHATVLTAVTSVVKNTEAPEGQQRVYRMKMTLDHSDGRWLVSNVEFVA
ncbi:hypothetical protein [Nocardia lijiangensis]|uniref:hypothetical protein n=1 Tax=Nocardia lijiangensis TaxID=299618 RepID=UPI003D74BFBC